MGAENVEEVYMDRRSKPNRGTRGLNGRNSRKWKVGRNTSFSWREFSCRLFEALDTPVSLGCYLRLKYECYDQLAGKTVSPSDYLHADRFFVDYQAVSLLRKAEFLPTTVDRRETGIKKFLEAELSCRDVNEAIFNRTCFPKGDVTEVIHLASRKIASILGDIPDLSRLDFRFGPGANLGVRGDTSVFAKMHAKLECSFALLPILGDFLSEFPSWDPAGSRPVADDCVLREVDVNVVEGSELTFVPKDAKTLRPICIEPLLESLYQKGIGAYIRTRLRRWGVQLNDQGVNQRLASMAHCNGLATVDLSSASDCISYGLVMELLPFPWFEFLEHGRSPRYHIEGNWYDFHKFTSMGNAYTFELETLIFFALAVATCEVLGIEVEVGENLHVYGDDIIIPRDAFYLFREVISRCGFSLNTEKSFVDSNFYESCGTDWFRGRSVRPFFLKKAVNKPEECYYVANSILGVSGTLGGLCPPCDSSKLSLDPRLNRLGDLHAWVVSCIPRRLRLCGPTGYGEGHLHASFDIARPTRAPRGWDGWCYRSRPEFGRPRPLGEEEVQTMAYATYHSRPLGSEDEGGSRSYLLPTGDRWLLADDSLYLRIWGNVRSTEVTKASLRHPTQDGPGYRYDIRGRSVYKTMRAFVGPVWPDCPPWTDRAIRLVTEGVEVVR